MRSLPMKYGVTEHTCGSFGPLDRGVQRLAAPHPKSGQHTASNIGDTLGTRRALLNSSLVTLPSSFVSKKLSPSPPVSHSLASLRPCPDHNNVHSPHTPQPQPFQPPILAAPSPPKTLSSLHNSGATAAARATPEGVGQCGFVLVQHRLVPQSRRLALDQICLTTHRSVLESESAATAPHSHASTCEERKKRLPVMAIVTDQDAGDHLLLRLLASITCVHDLERRAELQVVDAPVLTNKITLPHTAHSVKQKKYCQYLSDVNEAPQVALLLRGQFAEVKRLQRSEELLLVNKSCARNESA
eukprot:2417519-Rhodomonas_salina.3